MKLFEKYLFKKTGFAFLSILGVLILLIWFSRAIPFVKYVTENGVAISKFFYLFVLILPWLLMFVIPISLFAGVLLITNRMIATNEITILKNSGLTKLQISKPIILMAFLTSLFCFLLSMFLMPAANKELRISRVNIENNYANLSFAPQTFESLKDLTIYARKKDENNRLSGLLLYDKRNPEYSMTITAQFGRISIQDKSALLFMENGTIQKFNHQTQKTEIINFDDYVFNLTENQKGAQGYNWKPSELFIDELLNPDPNISADALSHYRSEINQRITYPLLPISLTLIALSFALSGYFSRRGGIKNTVYAIIVAAVFLGLIISSHNLIEKSPKFIPAPYLIMIALSIFNFKLLAKK